MPNKTHQAVADKRRQQLESLIRELDCDGVTPQSLVQAFRSCLIAMSYDDPALIRSHVNTVLEEFLITVNEEVKEHLKRITRITKGEVFELLQGYTCEDFDAIGKKMDASLTRLLESLAEFQSGPVGLLQERGYQVEGADQLKRAIGELQEFRTRVVENWPRSDQELPPVDRKMIAESRAAFRRGEGESIQDLIRRLEGNPADRS